MTKSIKPDANWALWYFNNYVRERDFTGEQQILAREFFMQGIHSALDHITERVTETRSNALRAIAR
jgi:hypothetical protein